MAILFKISPQFASEVASGAIQRFGPILKDTATGKIVGHLQQTSAFQSLISSGFEGAMNTVSQGFSSQGFSPLDVLDAVQNQQMLSKLADIQGTLTDIQGTMGILQNLQIGTLALSGANLGVSVVGFAVVLQRLNAIQSNLEEIDRKIEEVTKFRRSDDLTSLIARIEADVNGVGYLVDHPNPRGAAEALFQSLTRSTRKIEAILNRETAISPNTDFTIEHIDRVWSLFAILRVCQETSLQALFHADLLQIAANLAKDEATRLEEQLSNIIPDSLARLVAHKEPDWEKGISLRKAAFSKATILTDAIVENIIGMAGQSSLAQSLLDTKESGRELLLAAESEQEAPLMFLPSKP